MAQQQKKTVVKCFARMCLQRNLKNVGASEEQILEVNLQQISIVAEMVCLLWNSGMTHQEVRPLESVQRAAVAYIRGDYYTRYRAKLE